jgi:hypothetical protein
MGQPSVAVVIPFYHSDLSEGEIASLRQCRTVLRAYPHCLVAPESLELPEECATMVCERFAPHHFASTMSYNRLLINDAFYARFAQFDYILVYQLDAWVFRDELVAWCQEGFDYVGAPWIKKDRETGKQCFVQGGNGGFSLRRTASFRKVLSCRGIMPNWDRLQPAKFRAASVIKKTALAVKALQRKGIKAWSQHFLRVYYGAEDRFWASYAPRILPDFVVAPLIAEQKFSFEVSPRELFERNERQLPFGCHAWQKHDCTFWRSFIQVDTK